MDSACKKFLSRYPELRFINDTGKIQCSLSGHEMPCRVDVLKSYVSGKKFTKLKAHHDFDFSRLEPFLIPSKKRKYQLFCALTNRYVNHKPDEVKGHIVGRRYIQAMERYNAGELTLFQERLKRFQAADKNSIHEEAEAETSEMPPSEQISPDRTSPVQSDSEECAVWVPSDLDSDEAELEVNEEEADSSQRKEETSSVHDVADEMIIISNQSNSPSSKKERKRKRVAQPRASAMVKKRKLELKMKSRSRKEKNSKKFNSLVHLGLDELCALS